eukprot:CAMPEP_0117659986 /NCGR_PEP_ID=MMETSP0804-20121206/6723_1 /TAXON_ID=1074897 /ORGANISM="Tetraselmis astigmatica, Strain CCMP880" /LENGTH=956 /DNA_ID=CAMNT_0005466677 /DNA_START=184 /DNA_END=3056 /DNA_ORIENTATION=-
MPAQVAIEAWAEEGKAGEGEKGARPERVSALPLGSLTRAGKGRQDDMSPAVKEKERIRREWSAYSGNDLQKKLFTAASTNHVTGISKLLAKQGVDVNAQLEFGRTALFGACYAGHIDAVKALIEGGADVKLRDNHGVTALHYACLLGSAPECIEELMAAGADGDAADDNGTTPLLLALEHHTENGQSCLQALLKGGASADGLPGASRTPLHHPSSSGTTCKSFTPQLLQIYSYSATAWHSQLHWLTAQQCCKLKDAQEVVTPIDMFKGCLTTPSASCLSSKIQLSVGGCLMQGSSADSAGDGGADPCLPDSEGNLPVHYALDLGRLDSIKQILASELSLSRSTFAAESSLGRPNAAGLTVLHLAALHGNGLMCEFLGGLLTDNPEALNITDAGGHTALHLAAAEGHLECTQALAGCGIELDALTPQGLTALHFAIAKRNHDVAVELIESGTDLKMLLPNNKLTYLHCAAQNGMEDLLPVLAEHGAPLQNVDALGRTSLHVAANCGSDQGCRALVAMGLSVSVLDNDGKLPMHYAAMGGQVDSLQYLLQAGANLHPDPISMDARTFMRRDLMFIAALAGQEEAVAMLLDLDVGDMKEHVDRDSRTALHAAAMGGNPNCVMLLLDAGWNAEAVDFQGHTPLFTAADCSNTMALKVLLEAGATVAPKSKMDSTPLHSAAINNFAEGVICLVEAGHEVNVYDQRRRTPLHEAAVKGGELAALALVRLGADIEAKDKYGLSPVATAVAASNRRLAKSIEDEACRSTDFQKRDHLDAAYSIVQPSKSLQLPPDIDTVPERFAERRRGARAGLAQLDVRRSGDADGALDDLLSQVGSPSKISLRPHKTSFTIGKNKAARTRKGLLDGIGEDQLSEEEDGGQQGLVDVLGVKDEEMKEMLTELNRTAVRQKAVFEGEENDEDFDAVSLDSSLGSQYEYEDDGEPLPAKPAANAAVGAPRPKGAA